MERDTYNQENLENLRLGLKELKLDKTTLPMSKREIVAQLAKDIKRKQKQGISLTAIVECLNTHGLDIDVNNLKSTLSQLKIKKEG